MNRDSLAAIAALLIYPLVFFLIKDPASLKWARIHGFSLMPESVQLTMEATGRRLYFVKFLAVSLFLFVWAKVFSVFSPDLLASFQTGRNLFLLALASIAILAAARLAFVHNFERVRKRIPSHGFARGHLSIWLGIIFFGGFVEETWRAGTLLASSQAGFNSLATVVLTSSAFVFCQLLGIPCRILGIREEVLWELVVSVVLCMLLLVSHTLWVPVFVNVSYSLLNLGLVRRMSAHSSISV